MSHSKSPSNFFTPTKIILFLIGGGLFWLLLNSFLLHWHYQQGNTAYQPVSYTHLTLPTKRIV